MNIKNKLKKINKDQNWLARQIGVTAPVLSIIIKYKDKMKEIRKILKKC